MTGAIRRTGREQMPINGLARGKSLPGRVRTRGSSIPRRLARSALIDEHAAPGTRKPPRYFDARPSFLRTRQSGHGKHLGIGVFAFVSTSCRVIEIGAAR